MHHLLVSITSDEERTMWQHARTDQEIVQDVVDFSVGWLEERRYTLGVSVNMAAWAATMRQAPGMSLVNPTYDPHHSFLSPKNSFWLDVRAGSHTVGMIAGRLFATDDYLEVKRSMRLWYDPPRPEHGRLAISAPPGMPTICGKVAHEGGLWVHPQHRKRGLSTILPHLVRALCLREWDIDWLTGATMRKIGESGIASWGYGMSHVQPCFEGWFPVTQTYERLYIAYMDRRELIAGLDLDAVAGLLSNSDKQSLHPSLRVQEG
jgi:hypothetical protein